jgi:hypothetical protein
MKLNNQSTISTISTISSRHIIPLLPTTTTIIIIIIIIIIITTRRPGHCRLQDGKTKKK